MPKKIPSSSLKQFLKREIGNSKKVLDIGCGDGTLALYLIFSLGCYLDGIDTDKGAIHRANKKFRKQKINGLALCRLCKAEEINKKFQKNTFDAILIIHALHHLTNLSDVLARSKYVLKKEGKIFIGEYKPGYGEKRDNCPRFSERKIISMIKTAGFINIKSHKIHKSLIFISAGK